MPPITASAGMGIWEFAGSEVPGEEPDVVLACAGDVPTVETVAAAELLKQGAPGLKVRVVNVVDLMRLQDAERPPARAHSHGTSTAFSRRTSPSFSPITAIRR